MPSRTPPISFVREFLIKRKQQSANAGRVDEKTWARILSEWARLSQAVQSRYEQRPLQGLFLPRKVERPVEVRKARLAADRKCARSGSSKKKRKS